MWQVMMEGGGLAERVLLAAPLEEKLQLPPIVPGEAPGSPSAAPHSRGQRTQRRKPDVFVFNPFAEAFIAQGKAFTPVKHQAMLAEDLANLPQFLCQPDDIVLLPNRPSVGFLNYLNQAGFPLPEFVEFRDGCIDPAKGLHQRELCSLRPWAWGPDSVSLLEPLFASVSSEPRRVDQCFNDDIARLYSKAWSAGFLRKILAQCHGGCVASDPGAGAQSPLGFSDAEPWLCSEQEAGVVVDTLDDALHAIADIRRRGHHRVVVKEAHGLAGHNALRLWEPELLPAQRQWLTHALRQGRQLVVEPWLERELDFSVQLEMGVRGLELCGYTGLINDRKGQFLANWAEADYCRRLPARALALFDAQAGISDQLQRLYSEAFLLLETELRRVGFIGPVSIDAFIYRTSQGECRLKPVVEINPRYTMGRLAVELMKHAYPGSCGLLRLVTRVQARAEGFPDFSSYAGSLGERSLRLAGEPSSEIRQGVLCLNEPGQAQAVLATFEVSPALNLLHPAAGNDRQHSRLPCRS